MLAKTYVLEVFDKYDETGLTRKCEAVTDDARFLHNRYRFHKKIMFIEIKIGSVEILKTISI